MPYSQRSSNRVVKLVTLVMLVLAAPIVPTVVHGEMFGDWLEAWRSATPGPTTLGLLTALLLASDILLPVPSGPVATLAGAQLGFLSGAVVSWAGMTVGAVLAFVVSRRWGPWAVSALADEDDLNRLRQLAAGNETWLLVATRPIPVFAESAVILAGIAGISWRKFLPAVMLGNLILAVLYAAVGRYAVLADWLIPALVATAIAPLLLAVVARRALNVK